MRNTPIPICWLRLLLLIAVCLAVAGCRTPKKTATGQPLPPAKAATPPQPKEKQPKPVVIEDLGNLKDVGRDVAPSAIAVSTTADAEPSEKTVLTNLPDRSKPLAESVAWRSGISGRSGSDTGRQAHPEGLPHQREQIKAPYQSYFAHRDGADSPIPFPDKSKSLSLPVKTNTAGAGSVPETALPVDLWQPLTPADKRAAAPVPLRFGTVPASTSQPTAAISLPLLIAIPALNVATRDPAATPVLAVDPFLDDITNEVQRREWDLTRQEAERKARETERDNLNRVLYRFLLGK